MNREVARKRPANAPAYRPDVPLITPPWTQDLSVEVWNGSRYELLTRVRKATARGEVAEVGDWRPVKGAPGHFAVTVRRLKHPAPAWRRSLLVAGAAVTSVSGMVTAAVVMVPPLIGWAILMVGLMAIGGGVALHLVNRYGSISVTQNVSIRR